MFRKNTISLVKEVWYFYFLFYQNLSPTKKESVYVSERQINQKDWFHKIINYNFIYFLKLNVVTWFLLPHLSKRYSK